MQQQEMVGIIYAGGLGTRLESLTGWRDGKDIFHPKRNKQILPVGELGTPMFGYPLALMMRAGIKNILIPTFSNALDAVKSYYGDGSDLGIQIRYTDKFPDVKGPAENLYAAREMGFIDGRNVCVIYGDVSVHPEDSSNIKDFFEAISRFDHGALIASIDAHDQGLDPREYGVVSRDQYGRVTGMQEKPDHPASSEIQVGISIFDGTLSNKLDTLMDIGPSHLDGHMRETDVNKLYAREGTLNSFILERTRFIDCGNKALYRKNYAYVRKMSKSGSPVDTPEIVANELGLTKIPMSASNRVIPSQNGGLRMGPLSRFSPIS